MATSYDLGAVSTYALAVQYGFVGTIADWVQAIVSASETYDTLVEQIESLELNIPLLDSTLSYNDRAANAYSVGEYLRRLETLISTPLASSTIAGMTDTTKVYVYTGSEIGYTAGNWYYYNGTAWVSGGVYNAEAITTDTTLTIAGSAADAKKVGDELTDIKQDLEELQNEAGVTAELKSALLDIAENIAYINENGQTLYDNLYNALYPNASSISCVYTQTGTVYTTDTLDSLKDDLVVTAHYSDSTTKVLKPSDYTLTGTLTAGTSTVIVHYGNLETTFTVNVTARTLSSISAVYTQSGTVYTDDDLDSLKSDLVVTATYNDSSTEIIPSVDYELSGTLASGTSTITVTYENKTTTFAVNNVVAPLYSIPDFAEQTITSGGRSMTVKKENGYYTMIGKLANVEYIYPNGTVSSSKSNTLWFSIPANVTIRNEIHDLTWSNPNSYDVDVQSKYSKSDSTGNMFTKGFTMTANGSGTEPYLFGETDGTTQYNISGQALQTLRSSGYIDSNVTVRFRTRLFCDGVRYL